MLSLFKINQHGYGAVLIRTKNSVLCSGLAFLGALKFEGRVAVVPLRPTIQKKKKNVVRLVKGALCSRLNRVECVEVVHD